MCILRGSVWSSGARSGRWPSAQTSLSARVGRAQTVEVTTQGDAPKWPVQVWTDDEHVKWEPLADKGKFRVTADSEARLGLHHVRFADEDKATDALRYLVGPLAEINETEPNDETKAAGKVAQLPLVINGVLEKRGSVDTFEVELNQDQVLVAALEAHTQLRSPVDAVMQILSTKGTVLAQNLDYVGLDPRIEFRAPRKDRYLVRVFGFPETPDSTIGYSGGDNYVYRLSLTTGGWVRSVKPLAFERNQPNAFQLDGVQLAQTSATLQTPPEYRGKSWTVFTAGQANAPLLDVIDWPQTLEPARADNAPPPVLAIPGSLTGTLSRRGERDTYSFEAKKGDKLSIALTSRRLGLPMDGVLRVLDSTGKMIAREDDTSKEEDATLVFQSPADGTYVLEVTDAFSFGGPEWVYRIDVQPAQGDVGLTVKAEQFTGKLNEEFEIAVGIERRLGFDKPLSIALVGQPATVVCEPVKIDKDAKEAKLKVKATAAFRGPVRIVARREDQQDWQRIATLSSDASLEDLWLTVK